MKSLTIVLLMLSLQAVMSFRSRDLEKEPIKRCSIPKKLEGKFKVSAQLGSNKREMFTGSGNIHADATTGKAAVYEKVDVHGRITEGDMYMSNNITYMAIPSLDICQKKAMDIPILPGKVPKGVTLQVKRGRLQGVDVQIWEYNLKPGSRDGSTATLYLTEDKCMPLKVDMKLVVSGQSMYVQEDFDDMTEGVKDASVFNLPKICTQRSYYGNSHRVPRSVEMHIEHAVARHEIHRQMFA